MRHAAAWPDLHRPHQQQRGCVARCRALIVSRRNMQFRALNLVLAFMMLTASCDALPQSTTDVVTKYVDLEGPAVIAFLRPSTQYLQNADATASQEQVPLAIESTRICLGRDFATYQIVTADRIVVRSPGSEESFDLGSFAPLTGALLLRPNANPRILFAGGGPEALKRMLRPSASEYFEKKCDG